MLIKRDYMQYVNSIKEAEDAQVVLVRDTIRDITDHEVLSLLKPLLEEEKHHVIMVDFLLQAGEKLD
jgi:hypothetical protein